MGNRKNLPQHAIPTPSLRLIPAHFTEKNLRGRTKCSGEKQLIFCAKHCKSAQLLFQLRNLG
jgi:hypothetical protein